MPKWYRIAKFRTLDEKYKRSQKECYDKYHRVRPQPSLPEDQPVWVETGGLQIPEIDAPRSYIVEAASGHIRRNCVYLRNCSC